MSKKLLIASMTMALLSWVITDPTTDFLHHGIFSKYEASFLEPFFFLCLALAGSAFVLLFFSEAVFRIWWGRFMVWFGPMTLLFIASGNDGVSYGWFSKSFISVFFGIIIFIITIFITFGHRSSDKKHK